MHRNDRGIALLSTSRLEIMLRSTGSGQVPVLVVSGRSFLEMLAHDIT